MTEELLSAVLFIGFLGLAAGFLVLYVHFGYVRVATKIACMLAWLGLAAVVPLWHFAVTGSLMSAVWGAAMLTVWALFTRWQWRGIVSL